MIVHLLEELEDGGRSTVVGVHDTADSAMATLPDEEWQPTPEGWETVPAPRWCALYTVTSHEVRT